jgi:hypothetical protein
MDLLWLTGGACVLCFALGVFIGTALRRPPVPPEIQKEWFDLHEGPTWLREAARNAAMKEMGEPIPAAIPDWQSQFNADTAKEKHDKLSERAKAMPRDAVSGRFVKRAQRYSSQPTPLD